MSEALIIDGDGAGPAGLLAPSTPRGVRVDPAGRLWVASGTGVEILGAPEPGGNAHHLVPLADGAGIGT